MVANFTLLYLYIYIYIYIYIINVIIYNCLITDTEQSPNYTTFGLLLTYQMTTIFCGYIEEREIDFRHNFSLYITQPAVSIESKR